MTQFKAIAAMALNRSIGWNQQLPWHIPEELQWFRQTTLNQTLLMGRKTFESMGCRPLPHRITYILTSQKLAYKGVKTIQSIKDLNSLKGPIWICGGAHIYEQFLPLCFEIFLSVIQKNYPGDTFFPHFENFFEKINIIKKTDLFEVQHWIHR